MKTVDRMYPYAAFAVAAVLFGSSCSSDWGKVDPPAGVQTLPNLENVANFDFEQEQLDPMLFRANGNNQDQVPAIVEDEDKGFVLELNDGWVEMNNPLTNYKCEKAASLTFWLKQIPETFTDEEGNQTTGPQDVSGPLFAFTNQNRTEHLTFSANGGIEYDAADGTWSCDNPAEVTTGYIPVDGFDGHGWNYVALTVRNDGYDLYVNGEKKESKTVTDFDCSRLVGFMNNVATFSIGSADNHSHWMIDDLNVYRNVLTAKETARPRVSWEAAGPGTEIDLSSWLLVGLEDNSTLFWTEFSPYFSLNGDGQLHYQFYNYTRKTNNWDNWLLVIATGERGCDGYAEHAVIRADNFGWGLRFDAGDATQTCDFNFDTFKEDMDGALVDMTIDRLGTSVDVIVVVTTASGTVYNYKTSLANVEGDSITTWLLCEGSHLLLNPEGCFQGTLYDGGLIVGPQDNTAPWWSIWSPNNLLKGEFSNFGFDFINHNSGTGGNWNNWVLVCTNGKYIGEDGYAENFVLRSDAWGWGAGWDVGTVTSAFNWDTYVADMHDAHSRIYVERFGNDLLIVARQTTAAGIALPEYRFQTTVETPEIGLFFVLDSNWLEFNKVGFFPLIDMKPQN